MPRRARLDAPGTLHHVIVRGIEKRRIVNDVSDRKNLNIDKSKGSWRLIFDCLFVFLNDPILNRGKWQWRQVGTEPVNGTRGWHVFVSGDILPPYQTVFYRSD